MEDGELGMKNLIINYQLSIINYQFDKVRGHK